MEFIPIKTRVLNPPQDNLFAVLDEYLIEVKDGDVVLISSKVVAIHQGRCVKTEEVEKSTLLKQAADLIIPRNYWPSPITVAHNTFIGAAGIDKSNGDGYYVLPPENTFASAQIFYNYLCKRFNLKNLGVIITDSHSGPFRQGATGVSLSWWGIEPLLDHRGRKDLFGRSIKSSRSNLVDGLAAGATVVSGEVDECLPVIIARNVPGLIFTTENTRHHLFTTFADDTFRVLYERFLP